MVHSPKVIADFKHRGLKRFFFKGDKAGLPAQHLPKIEAILAVLELAEEVNALDIPGWHLHTLKGELKGYWSVKVSANWRIMFRFQEGIAHDVELVDYH